MNYVAASAVTDRQTDRQTDTHTHTQTDYRNLPAHARRGLIILSSLESILIWD